MTYSITERIEVLTLQLHALRVHVDTLLDVASSDARKEWQKLVARVPAVAALRSGVLTTSEAELEEMTSKASRFAAILQVIRGQHEAPADPTESTGRHS